MPRFLALFVATPVEGPKAQLDDATIQKGLEAWRVWSEKHAGAIVEDGGPLGATKRVTNSGIEDVNNNVALYLVVEADSHEAAAEMFQDHPHFTVFDGDGVEVMPLLPAPGSAG